LNVEFQGPCLGCQISTLLAFQIVLVIQTVDFLSVLAVSLSQIMQLFLQVLLLSQKLAVQVLMLSQVVFKPRYFRMPAVEGFFLVVELSVEISVLFLAVHQKTPLVVDFLAQR
jgi:hypothetical protein